ncbi:Polysaccharide deacetylase [Selenomonas sp. GACV-9]|nr:Polysaccharide deacetylase [Selenomonas ruminantium]
MVKYIKRMLLAVAAMLLIFLCWLLLTPMPTGIPVLEYHMVNDEDNGEGWSYNVPPEEFRQQLDYLQQQGYTTITMLEFMKAKKGKLELPEKPVILTFDDGYEDNYTTMLPMLEERGMKAVVYMVTNDIGRPKYLSWNQLRDMQQRGIEIGSHTANHQPLTHLDPEKQAEEMKLSKLIMEWNGIHTVFSFSYPNGAYSDDMPAMLAENEYLTAVTGDAGLNTFATNPYLLQRVNIPHPRFGLTEFKLRLWKAAVMTKLGVKQH